MNKNYNLKLDLQFRCNNSKMIFDEFDENTSDFFMQITRQGEKIDISNAIPTLLVLKPSGTAVSQILNVKDNLIYGNLNNSLKNEVGTYIAKLMLIEGDKKTFISNISYEVTENALLGMIDNDIVEDERYSVLIQLLERLSNIELQEQTRVDNENSRIEAENLREEAVKKIKNDIDVLINETNKKVSDNLNSNTFKIDNLIIDTKEELNKYKENKDKFINEDLEEFKENINKSIDNYKTSKDVEINNSLNTYKTNTTNDINSFKNTVNSGINKYKNDKDKAINEYIEGKSLELDNYVEAKNNELDLYVSEKNILIDSKVSEVDNAKTQMQDSINNKLIEVDNAEQIRQQEHEERQQLLNGFEGKLNTVVNDVAGIKDDVVSVREANKRQDVFLQGLYNENLDGRVTVKEEGSAISLINSNDGLVDIIGLEGNTLVNYCIDGAKELTLNGDIDVEGTNVTLTDTVDNGLVDVICEGNTLVNLMPNIDYSSPNINDGTRLNYFSRVFPLIQNNKTYTIVFNNYCFTEFYLSGLGLNWMNVANKNIFTFTVNVDDSTFDSSSPRNFQFNTTRELTSDELMNLNFILLEGDYTNKPIPPYFEGMKSVGECEDNKIEILSTNSDNTLSNKKQITLSEPLRALPNGVKDKIVKIGGKWYVERNCGEYIIDGTSQGRTNQSYNRGTEFIMFTKESDTPVKYPLDYAVISDEYQSIRKWADLYNLTGQEGVSNVDGTLGIGIRVSNTKTGITENDDSMTLTNKLLTFFQNNPVKVVYALKTPTYEELPIEPTVNTYNDITHISNNSTIPCNMKVTNTGYNAIIKPSTQYTVAFDTNKSGEVGINLGGSKVTTINNVATITTPSTLVDDSLRLTGKGIKASKVRLLEGDKTNWIPSFFEGMKSSFEDNLQDNKYKIDCKVIGKNLFNTKELMYGSYISGGGSFNSKVGLTNSDYHACVFICVKPLTTYYIKSELVNLYVRQMIDIEREAGFIEGYNSGHTINTNYNTNYLAINLKINDSTILTEKDILNSYIQLQEGVPVTAYEPHKSNKIQFSSIEPLRGVGDVKDRFVFKNGKLMIERNCIEIAPSGDEVWHYWDSNIGLNTNYMSFYMSFKGMNYKANKDYALISDILIDSNNTLYYRDLKSNSVALNEDKNISLQIGIKKSDLQTQDVNGFKQWLKTNKPRITYLLATPVYEEITPELQKIILEGYESGTLFLDTNIPPTVEASYTANIPLVSKVNEVNNVTEINTEDIAITQMAVDFLLMSSLGEEMLNFKVKSGYNMASYFASRIIKGALKYEDVIKKYPQYKEDINSILASEGYSDLIIEL